MKFRSLRPAALHSALIHQTQCDKALENVSVAGPTLTQPGKYYHQARLTFTGRMKLVYHT